MRRGTFRGNCISAPCVKYFVPNNVSVTFSILKTLPYSCPTDAYGRLGRLLFVAVSTRSGGNFTFAWRGKQGFRLLQLQRHDRNHNVTLIRLLGILRQKSALALILLPRSQPYQSLCYL